MFHLEPTPISLKVIRYNDFESESKNYIYSNIFINGITNNKNNNRNNIFLLFFFDKQSNNKFNDPGV